MTDSSPVAPQSVDKFDAARRQIECAIRLVAAEEDELAIHTIVMAAYSILEDLSKDRRYYEEGIKTHLTKIGRKRFRATANFLKHADRDSGAVLKPCGIEDIEWRIGLCVILYRDLKEKFTPEMAAFHNWMVIRHPDEFMLAEDEDRDFEELYRQGTAILDRPALILMLNTFLKLYRDGIISPDVGFRRRPTQ
jgi:hypothetical protein